LAGEQRVTPFATFRVKSFRYQFPSDLFVSLGFEMEAIILGWYIFEETGSVILLTVYGSLRFIGTLLAPWTGLIGDRLSRRRVLYTMRACLAILAGIILISAWTGHLNPYLAFAVAFFSGLIQPSDILNRNALIGDSMPSDLLMSASSLSRIAMDGARVFGALTGAGLFAALGMHVAYTFVVAVYVISALITLGVTRAHPRRDHAETSGSADAKPSQFAEIKEGLVYTWKAPAILAIMWLAFLVNLTAFPVTHGLLPFVAKEVMSADITVLGNLVAAFSMGAVAGSFILSWFSGRRYAARLCVLGLISWHVMVIIFARFDTVTAGMIVLFFTGVGHSIAMASMTAALLSVTDPMIRGRVMGIRVLCIYGLPLGLLGAGFLIESLGWVSFVDLYNGIGIALTILIAFRWRAHIWQGKSA
jgi:Na+/melibiose symporter-like transporter